MKPDLSVVGIDSAKRIFHLIGMDERGKIILRKRLVRGEVISFMAKLPPVTVGMEACGGSHYWARRFREQGHEVKLMAPQYVKPYVKTNKNDLRDAEAIAEAVTRPSMRFVPIKEVEHQDIQALHRVRDRLMGSRTALVNEMRGLLAEYGIVLPKGVNAFRKLVVEKLDAEQAKLTPLTRQFAGFCLVLRTTRAEWRYHPHTRPYLNSKYSYRRFDSGIPLLRICCRICSSRPFGPQKLTSTTVGSTS